MKRNLSSSFAIALLGALSLVSSLPFTPARAATAEPVRLHVDVDRSILPAETTERAVIKVGLDCDRPARRELRPPVNIAIVIDRSGSMSGDKIVKARQAALEAVRRLPPDDLVALVVYAPNGQTLIPAQRVGDG